MTRKYEELTSKEFGIFAQEQHFLWERVRGGLVPFDKVIDALRLISSGRFECVVTPEQAEQKVIRKSIPTWLSAQTGRCKTASEYIAAIETSGARTVGLVRDLMVQETFHITAEITQIAYGRAKLCQLGFTNDLQMKHILMRIKELGYKPCLPEDGPILRAAYQDQPVAETLVLGMKGIRDSRKTPFIFELICDHTGRVLEASYNYHTSLIAIDTEMVFRL